MKLDDFFKDRALADNAGVVKLSDGSCWEVLRDVQSIERTIATTASLIVVHNSQATCKMHFDVCQGAVLHLIEIFSGDCFAECNIHQQAESRCNHIAVNTSASIADYTIDLDGAYAVNNMRAAYIVGAQERTRINLRVNHNVPDCVSDSLVKGVAGGFAVGEFHGMVYVAQDAQRTDASQTNRNIEIGPDAKIITKPQLEIYADDVKCSHGATVGQMDGEAIMYMRQRGLSEQQARRLQIEGFINDIVLQAGELGEVMSEMMTSKLERL